MRTQDLNPSYLALILVLFQCLLPDMQTSHFHVMYERDYPSPTYRVTVYINAYITKLSHGCKLDADVRSQVSPFSSQD